MSAAAGAGQPSALGATDGRSPAALDTCDALDDLLASATDCTSEAGIAAHATLFGPRGLHRDLVVLASQRNMFASTIRGNVRSTADFAVTSGHEALACFAERVASYAKVRRDTIPRIQAELDSARMHGRALVAEQKQAALMLAGEDFAKALMSAFSGWDKERAWIRRSIQDEGAGKDTTRPQGPDGVPAHLSGARAAKLIGVSAPTLSRWHSKVPVWAKDRTYFMHLIDREDGRYDRDRILKLAAWFDASRKNGGQTPIACP